MQVSPASLLLLYFLSACDRFGLSLSSSFAPNDSPFLRALIQMARLQRFQQDSVIVITREERVHPLEPSLTVASVSHSGRASLPSLSKPMQHEAGDVNTLTHGKELMD